MPGRDVVLIGASAGGFDALRRLLGGLPAGLPASVLVVVHITPGPNSRTLPDTLARSGCLPAAYAVPGQRLTPGLVTVAPPGQHLVVTDGDVLRLHRGPLVHRVRPAVDVLLHSAARHCGERAIAVVLSGSLRDGAEGAAAVAAAGGAVLVQDPADAGSPDMPAATLARVPGAGAWPAAKLGPAIADLLGTEAPRRPVAADHRVEGIADALWTAVSQLHADAAVQQRLQQRFAPTHPLVALSRSREERMRQAAELITDRVLPNFRPGAPPGPPTDGG
ncbi:chemotaxis protein CheB [Saccharothrix syringae]|uniref:protein-glutamate methylesterase n=1 Tax=Saccharothrix syringae TaxID=103733 RepID=A0A5Q0H3F0_SACSY|nr:chemotaxis protein CheB [Saccharothrix syringae]QFZ20758.1 chemotaxis protein CheB [Saccharothrix syringae]